MTFGTSILSVLLHGVKTQRWRSHTAHLKMDKRLNLKKPVNIQKVSDVTLTVYSEAR